ncbi:MAG: histidine kinase [Zunongwangia sp.]|uniref:sensor histidine kinase n=1 Tax=Microbacterium sp. UBA3394 TaxID=1946945 RepID=UPI000C953504|nr:sensor histidine kinase [Microbacterium sp. UBA3394]MAO34541.1 histidine kinase [Zunongwangia sp.]|tara:strand:+ start:2278 stop:4386 length:2109 start_codon:yes stop_codon:yes gene_type:complete
MTREFASRAATLVAVAVSALSAVVAIALDIAVLPTHPEPPVSSGWSGVLPGAAMLIPGALLLWRLPWHPIAVVLTAFGTLWVLDGMAAAAVNLAWYHDRSAWWAVPAFWFFSRAGAVLILPIVLLLLLFPDGRLRAGVWRVVSIVSLALGLVMPFAFLFAPRAALSLDNDDRTALLDAFEQPLPTLPLPLEAWMLLLGAGIPCLGVSLLLALLVCISRRFGATAEQRAQLRWLVWSALIFTAALLFVFPVVPTVVVDLLLAVTIGLVSASVVIAVTRYRLYAIDRLLSWTLVYALLIAGIIAIDVLIVVAVGSAIDDRVAMLLAVVAVTVAFAPLRGRLFAVANRLVSGRRGDPYAVVSSLGDRLDQAPDAPGQLAELAAAIAEAFGSRSVRVELDRPGAEAMVAVHGTPMKDAAEVPIDHGGEMIGRIFIEPGGRPVVSTRDQWLLGDLVRLAAASLRGAELGRELQANRERLVLAREEERSRLRRELHDGLGPLLAGVKLRLETARNLADRDPARSLGLVDAAIADQSEVIDEIRRIVQGLRPPALDDLGLRSALEQQAARLTGGGLIAEVSGDVPHDLPPAVEVAAFRIASEALTNARKHSGAQRVQVVLSQSERMLQLDIRDDGHGIASATALSPATAPSSTGVGLRSQRERAAELGGTLEITSRPDGGTLIRARLPFTPPASAPTDTTPEGITADVR